MTFLITGSSGQLAGEFQQHFERDGVAYQAPSEAKLDITDATVVRRAIGEYRPDVVVNCAAFNDVRRAELGPEPAYAVNTQAVRNLADACAQNDTRLVHFGTDYVFDGTKEAFYTEDDPTHPLNNYGRSKRDGEVACQSSFESATSSAERRTLTSTPETGNVEPDSPNRDRRTSKQETGIQNFPLILRVSWVYGPGEQNFFYKLQQWARKNDVLKVVWDQLSVPTYTADIVRFTLQAVEAGLRGTYHLTNSGYASRYETARHFFRKKGNDKLILPVSTNEFDTTVVRPYFSKMSNRKLSDALNVRIPPWEDALDRFVKRDR